MGPASVSLRVANSYSDEGNDTNTTRELFITTLKRITTAGSVISAGEKKRFLLWVVTLPPLVETPLLPVEEPAPQVEMPLLLAFAYFAPKPRYHTDNATDLIGVLTRVAIYLQSRSQGAQVAGPCQQEWPSLGKF